MRTILITGATSGIGKSAAKALSSPTSHLILIGRDEDKLRKTVDEVKEAGAANTDYFKADLSEKSEISRLSELIRKNYQKVDVLINNAGAYYEKRITNSQGIEYTFALNHLAYFQLTLEIMGLLRNSDAARIVNVSSEAERPGHIHFDDINLSDNYSGFKAYCQSKLANLLFTYELDRKLRESGITNIIVNAMHPGVVRTGFGRNNRGIMNLLVMLTSPFMRSPEKGAETVVFLAESETVANISGKYWKDKKQLRSNEESYSPDIAAKLWDLSLEMTDVPGPLGLSDLKG